MHGRWARPLVAAVFALGLAFAACGTVFAQARQHLSLQSGHSTILNVSGLSRVAVGDSKIAGAVPIGTSQVIVNGKTPGRTSVYIWSADGERDYELTVTPQELDDVSAVLRSTITVPGVSVVDFGRAIVVRGSVSDNSQLAYVQDMIGRFDAMAKLQGYTIVNAVTVSQPFGSLTSELNGIPGVAGVRLDADGKGNVIVSGRVHDQTQAQMVISRAQGLAGPYLSADGKVINRLAVETTSQIDIKVYVLEIDRTGLSQLGVRLQSGTPDPNNPRNIIIGDPIFPVFEGPQSGGLGKAFNVGAFFRTTMLTPTIDAILRTGHARMLSAPDLVTLPGNKANFLVGGQIPYAYSTGLGQVSVVFKDYGVQLTVTPTILGNGAVESKIQPEISDLDYQNAVSIAGSLVPALRTSKMDTDVVTRDGEGIVMGGMLKHLDQKDLDKLPVLGDLPILGPLFRSTRYQTSQTDVVFVLVPQVITL